MNHQGWRKASFPPSNSIFWDSFRVFLGMHKVLLCLSLVSLALHPSSIPRHQAHPSPSRKGGKFMANTTKKKPNFGCCVLGHCFLHRCVSCNTSCKVGFPNKTKQKKGIPQFSFPPGELPWLFSSQAAAHPPLLLCLLSHIGALHLRKNRGTLRHRPTRGDTRSCLFSFQDNFNHFLRGIFSLGLSPPPMG